MRPVRILSFGHATVAEFNIVTLVTGLGTISARSRAPPVVQGDTPSNLPKANMLFAHSPGLAVVDNPQE